MREKKCGINEEAVGKRGRGRPVGSFAENTMDTMYHLRMDDETNDILNNLCSERNMSRAALLRDLIHKANKPAALLSVDIHLEDVQVEQIIDRLKKEIGDENKLISMRAD